MITRRVTASPSPSVEFAPTTADVAVVTVTFGTSTIVLDMLRSLASTTPAIDGRVEVVVVDQPHPRASRTAPILHLATRGVQVVETSANYGFGGGCEIGVACTTAPTIAFINPDVTLQPGWYEPLAAQLADDPRTIAAPVFVRPDGSVAEVGLDLGPDGRPAHRHERPGPHDAVEVDYASAACWLVTRDFHRTIGGFDADFHPAYYEDVDLAVRARHFGGRCVVHGGASVVHVEQGSTPDRLDSFDHHLGILQSKWPRYRPADERLTSSAATGLAVDTRSRVSVTRR